MDDDTRPMAIGTAVLWMLLAPQVLLLIPGIFLSGRAPAWESVAIAYSGWPIVLVYVACLAALLLRWRAPLGGGNSFGAVFLMSLATSFAFKAALSDASSIEAFGAYLFTFFMALPGAALLNLGLVSWGRHLIATDDDRAAHAQRKVPGIDD